MAENTKAKQSLTQTKKGKTMTITHKTEQQFYDTVSAMVIRGLMFKADADTLTITLTGGY